MKTIAVIRLPQFIKTFPVFDIQFLGKFRYFPLKILLKLTLGNAA